MSETTISAIPGCETFLFAPEGLGTDRRISIARTFAGEGAAPALVFVLDADFCFGTVVEAARMGFAGGEVGPAIIVGIGYAEESGDYAFAQFRRGLDLYRGPARVMEIPAVGSLQLGGADVFLAALVDGVLPEIERRIEQAERARRLLFGMSAGGHFATYTLMQRPDVFQGYALMSPALIDYPPAPGDEQLVGAIRNQRRGSIPAGTRVFLSAGAREEQPSEALAAASIISNAYRMRAALEAHGVSTEFALFADETHISVLGAAVGRALRFLVPAAAPARDCGE